MISKNKFETNYWLRKIYTSKFFQFLTTNNSKLKKKVFTSIYKSNHWVQDQDILSNDCLSVSGHGSNLNTNQFNDLFKNFNGIIEKKKITSILDMPCGDFLWLHEIIKNKNITYHGVDIVNELIESNRNKYKNKKFNFESCDILDFTTDKKFDLILIRDLFIHITNSDIKKIIQNVKKMDFKYILLNSYDNKTNNNVIVGQHRKINLLIDPFEFGKPTYHFKDFENDKYFFLYDKKDFI